MYDTWARAIAAGDWMGREAFYFPPLYPYLLGTLYRVAGRSLPAVYLAQSVLGLATIFLIHRVGRRAFGERAALAAAAGAALYAPFSFFEMKVLGTTLGVMLACAALALLAAAEDAAADGRATGRRWFGAGAVVGLAAACVPGTLLLAALYAAWLIMQRRAAWAGSLLAGCALVSLPVLAHNLIVASDPLPFSGQGGMTFYQGNNPNAAGMYSIPPGFTGSAESQAIEETSLALRETGRLMKRSESSAYFLRRGLAYIASHPGSWLILEGRKILYLFGTYEGSTEYSLYEERRTVPWLHAAFLPFAALIGAGLGGMLLVRQPRPAERALRLYALHAAIVPLLFYVSGRYRLPLAPALLLYGGAFVDRLVAAARAGAWSRDIVRAAAVALLVALVSFFPLGRPVASAEANVQYSLGNLLAERGRNADAVAAFDRAVAEWPAHAFAWINRGNSLDKLGREEEAFASYQRAEEANPNLWLAYKAQGILLHRDRRYAEEEAVYRRGLKAGGEEAAYLLAVSLKNQERLDEAVAALREALRINPTYARAHTRLGEILARQGDPNGARAEFQRALAADPGDTAARAGLNRLGAAGSAPGGASGRP